jgi:hypothetical protein
MEYEFSQDYLYINNKFIMKESSFKKIKENIKNEYETPKKDIKGYLVKFNVKNTKKEYLRVTITEVTITPKLFIGASNDDLFKVFTFSPEEYKKYKISESLIKKMIKAIKNDSISFEEKESITDFLMSNK